MLYILHFDKPLGSGKYGQAQSYLGYCADNRLQERLEQHFSGNGSAITRACVERGISMRLVATHEGTAQDEKRYKKWKSNWRVLKAWIRERRGN